MAKFGKTAEDYVWRFELVGRMQRGREKGEEA
jgi:hypothetical protein